MSYFKVSIVYLLLGWLRLVNGNTSEYANGECVGGILGPGGKGMVWLQEDPFGQAVSVAVPNRTGDLSCYVRTINRRIISNLEGPSCRKKRSLCKQYIAVTIHGEQLRLDPNSTIGTRVVHPYNAAGYEVVVFLTLQVGRPKKTSWHFNRFKNLPSYSTQEEQQAAMDKHASHFIASGAAAVVMHTYDLIRLPPMMPSSRTGGPGKGTVKRFELMWMSYIIHCLVHSNVWHDVEMYEGRMGRKFDLLIKTRADSFWLSDASLPYTQHAGSVSVKQCLSWTGYNDKFAYIPRKYAKAWMQLLEAYHDPTYFGFKNSEQLQKMIATRHNIPVVERRDHFNVWDYYWWMNDRQGIQGCFPANYVGFQEHTAGGKCLPCFSSIVQCESVRKRVCPHTG